MPRGYYPSRLALLAICLSLLGYVFFHRLINLADDRIAELAQRGNELRRQRPRPAITESGVVILVWTSETALLREELVKQFPKRVLEGPLKNAIADLEMYVDEPEVNKDFTHSALNMFPLTPHIVGHISITFEKSFIPPGDYEALLRQGEAIANAIQYVTSTATYVVLRSVYTEYGEYDGLATAGWDFKRKRTWSKGERSPFIGAHSLFPKPEAYRNVSNEEWAKTIWWKQQSPMSEMMQPRARYVRNVVVKAGDNAPEFGGIVIEMWPSKKHMDDPFLFFDASDWKELILNIAVMVRCVMRFTDVTVLQGRILSEYIF